MTPEKSADPARIRPESGGCARISGVMETDSSIGSGRAVHNSSETRAKPPLFCRMAVVDLNPEEL